MRMYIGKRKRGKSTQVLGGSIQHTVPEQYREEVSPVFYKRLAESSFQGIDSVDET